MKLSTSDEERDSLLRSAGQQQVNSVAITISPEIQGAPCCSSKGSASTLSRQNSSKSDSSVIGTCRICFETETADSQDAQNPLICPCHCSGSSKYVHRQCLQQWRATNHRADAYYQCEVCKYRYQYRRLWWATVLGSQATLAVLFVIIISSCIAVLGFVPLLNGWSNSSTSSSGGSPSGGGGHSGQGGGSSPAPDPTPPSSGSPGTGLHVSMILIHIGNGVLMLGVAGLVLSLLIGVGRGCGVPGLMLLPEPWCPSCMFCLDVNSGSGLGWAPLLECSTLGECGVVMMGVLAVVLLVVGLISACYMLYGVLWLLVEAGLGQAQQMVENVQQEQAVPSK